MSRENIPTNFGKTKRHRHESVASKQMTAYLNGAEDAPLEEYMLTEDIDRMPEFLFNRLRKAAGQTGYISRNRVGNARKREIDLQRESDDRFHPNTQSRK